MKNPLPWRKIMSHSLLCIGIFMMPVCASAQGPDPTQGNPADTFEPASISAEGCSDSRDRTLEHLKKDGKLHLTLNNCLRIALERNRDIHFTDEALLQAEADITQARSAMLPFLGAEATYTRLDEDIAFSLGPISLGAMSLPPISATFIDRDIYKAGVVLRQPIFAGGRLNAAHKAAQYSRDAMAQEKRTVEDEIVFQVTRAYHTVQVADAFCKVAIESVHLLETHAHDVAILVREGANPELDLLRTRTELANAQKELNATQNALDIALSGLKNLLVVDLEEPVFLEGHLHRRPGPEEDLLTLTHLAVSQRPEVSSLSSGVEAAEQGLKAARGEYLPEIALEGRYEYMKGDFRDLEGGDHWTVGIGAQVPLWNWKKTAAGVRKARSRLEQAKIQLKKTKDHIRLQVRKAFLDLGKAQKNITAAETALETGREAYRLARASYQAGAGTNTDVLDARTALSRAEANHAQALFEYNVALAALRRAVGTKIMDRKEIEKEEPSK